MKYKCKICNEVFNVRSEDEAVCPRCRARGKNVRVYEEQNPYAGTQTEKNLQAAFAGEQQARNKYTYFASKAKKEGFEQIASEFEGVARIEKEHEERYLKLLENVKGGKVFVGDDVVVWKCRNCGHIHIGKFAPEVCPVCAHPRAYFELRARNY